MQAILKSENKMLINGADHSEKILVKNFVDLSKDTNKEVKFEDVLDINGEITGCMISIVDKEVQSSDSSEPTETTDNEESGEPTDDTEE